MIDRVMDLTVRTSNVQFLLRQAGIYFDPQATLSELEALVPDAPVMRPVTSTVAYGGTANPSTTVAWNDSATVTSQGVGGLVLPDPRVQIALLAGQNVSLTGTIVLLATQAIDRLHQLVVSSNSGTTWARIGQTQTLQQAGGALGSVLLADYTAGAAGTYLFGINIGSDGSNTLTAFGAQRSLRVLTL